MASVNARIHGELKGIWGRVANLESLQCESGIINLVLRDLGDDCEDAGQRSVTFQRYALTEGDKHNNSNNAQKDNDTDNPCPPESLATSGEL